MAEPVDINKADQEELDLVEGLQGHGPEIVRFREESRGFTSIDQLGEVPGFAGKLTDGIRARLIAG